MPKKAAEPAKPEPAEETGVPIVVRRAMMKDDAVSAPPEKTESADASNPIEVKSKKSRIEPLSTPTPEPEAEKPATTEPVLDLSAKPVDTPQPAPATTTATPEKSTAAASPKTKTPAPEAASAPAEPAAAADAPTEGSGEFTLAGADSVDTPDDPSQNPIDQAKAKADKEAAEKQAALDKLVDAQTYFLPINSVEKRRTKQLLFVTLLLLIVLAGAGAFWANGQGIISIPGL